MGFEVEHKERFDAAGKLDADDWLFIPRAQLKPDFALDAALADEMVRRFLARAAQQRVPPLRIINDARGVWLRAPLGKTALVLLEPERIVDAQRAETSWRIAGGFLLAHHVPYGGRFYLGGEWQPDGALKLYSTVRRYPPRVVHWFGGSRGVAVYNRTQGLAYKQLQEKFLKEMARVVTR
ncbi:MAG TPA: hypothetical protein VFD70_16905 [Anaerolineae bacterium]|nr:hypothetical protein [Anaerolineae bacterium]